MRTQRRQPSLRVDLPDGAELASRARSPIAFSVGVVDLDRPVGFREDPRDRVLDALEVARIGDRPAGSSQMLAMTSSDVTPADSRRRDATRRLRVVVADDDALLREGIASLLEDAGPRGRRARARRRRPACSRCARTCPTSRSSTCACRRATPTTGCVAAAEIRRTHPTVAVLVLSQHLEPSYMLELVGDDASGVGYLLKDRVRDVAEFVDAVERVAAGGTAFDPEVVKSLVGGRRGARCSTSSPTASARCSSLIAEGRSNRAIAEAALPQPARGRAPRPGHLPEARACPRREDDNRRVLAVLALLGH